MMREAVHSPGPWGESPQVDTKPGNPILLCQPLAWAAAPVPLGTSNSVQAKETQESHLGSSLKDFLEKERDRSFCRDFTKRVTGQLVNLNMDCILILVLWET